MVPPPPAMLLASVTLHGFEVQLLGEDGMKPAGKLSFRVSVPLETLGPELVTVTEKETVSVR